MNSELTEKNEEAEEISSGTNIKALIDWAEKYDDLEEFPYMVQVDQACSMALDDLYALEGADKDAKEKIEYLEALYEASLGHIKSLTTELIEAKAKIKQQEQEKSLINGELNKSMPF